MTLGWRKSWRSSTKLAPHLSSIATGDFRRRIGSSPKQLERELNLARCAGRSGYSRQPLGTRPWEWSDCVRQVEIRAVEKVEYLCPKLKIESVVENLRHPIVSKKKHQEGPLDQIFQFVRSLPSGSWSKTKPRLSTNLAELLSNPFLRRSITCNHPLIKNWE